MSVRVTFEVERDGLRVGIVEITNLHVKESTPDFENYEQSLFNEIRNIYSLEGLKDDPILRSYRDLYWTFGMDPTKLRISSEAVQRRILRGLNLWRISNIVDTINLASAYHSLPISLIDDSKRNGDLVIRQAAKNEVFMRIGGKSITCRGREIVVADNEKICCFGYATHDSESTKVTTQSTNVLVLLYGSSMVSKEKLESSMQITAHMIGKWIDCTVGSPTYFRS
ncbi:MAG: phenylalanine--tRNA ligase beta subunit-related protein [Candidatus Thorarchaeota archaeon]